MPRIKFLSDTEYKNFDSPPRFNIVERKKFFDIPSGLRDTLAKLRTSTNQVCFIVSLGYFQATKRFFARQFHDDDIKFVASRLGFFPELIDIPTYEKSTFSRHRKLILEYLGYKEFNDSAKYMLGEEIRHLVRTQMRPKLILTRMVEVLETKKFEVPTARVLTELIADETKHHNQELSKILENQVSIEQRQLLDDLLEKDKSFSDPDSEIQRFRVTLLKRFSQSMKPGKIRTNVEDLKTLRDLFYQLEQVIEMLNLTHEGIRYYATSVIKARVTQISKRSEDDRHLHLVCFVSHQYFRLQDTLVDVLIASVQNAQNACTKEHKDKHYEERIEQRRSIKKFIECVDRGAFNPLSQIEVIAFDNHVPDTEKVQRIQSVFSTANSERTKAEKQLSQFKDNSNSNNDVYFDILESKSVKLQNRVSDIVKELNFEGDDSALMLAINNYKQKGGVITEIAPTEFLDENERAFFDNNPGKFRISLYKALLFVQIADAIKSGTLNVPHSYRYRSLEDYLIPKNFWNANREYLLQRSELVHFAECKNTLKGLAETLDAQYAETNRRIIKGENQHIRFRKDQSFVLTTPKKSSSEAEPLFGVFPEKRYISLLEVLSTVNGVTNFIDEFKHWQIRYNRTKPPEKTFFAGIIGYGCFIGTRKIARISKLINESELENAVNWYFTLETINAANDQILTFTDKMELPEIYRDNPDVLHTSSDGQKFEVGVDSLNANYSFKYFGQDKGVSAYNFIDQRNFLFSSTVISSAEREAAYVIDGLMHNDVVKSDIHSTDTHGYSEVIFAVMYLLGFTFAPRIKNLKKQQLYSFKSRKDYKNKGYKVLPDGYINIRLIEENWDDILRFVATIKLKETTASQLFKRLNSYSKQHPLYKALKEFGKVVKSIFVLQYIDDVELRQAIDKQLNKSESSNKFSRAVSFGNNQEFLQGEKVEQEIAEGCRRLIKNAIICWNYLYLSQKIANEENVERKKLLISSVRNGSVVCWQHLNLHGEYDFSDDKLQDSMGLRDPKILKLNLSQY